MSGDIFPLTGIHFRKQSVISFIASWWKRQLPTGDTTGTNTRDASNCVRWHWWRTNNESNNKSKRKFGTIRTRCRWVAKDYSFIMFWNRNIRSPKSNCRTRQKVICHKYINNNNCASLESLVACRSIPLNKNPELMLIGVAEVLRKISGKVVMMISKQNVMKTAGSL